MSKDGRLTVPKVIAGEFLEESEEESLNGYTAEVYFEGDEVDAIQDLIQTLNSNSLKES